MDPFTPGFGEWQGIPRRTVAEDVVEYFVFLPNVRENLVAQLEQVKRTSEELADSFTEGYIWQKDGFALEISEAEGFTCLKGETEFGDAIDDEWFIVFILRELSMKVPDAWIRVTDADGEFLLVEAANTLPKWLNPEIAGNRVWIHDGKLLIIPLTQEQRLAKGKGISRALSMKEAMDAVKRYEKDKKVFMHSPMIEAEAFYRVSKYPKAAKEHMHHALVRIPLKVAMLLREKPGLVSRAVEAFYVRDAKSLRICEGMPDFPPSSSITTSVTFTKVLYAQLKTEEFNPSPTLGFIPPEESSPSYSAWKVGMKLAIGFQILARDKAFEEVGEEIKELLGEMKEPTKADIESWPKTQDDESWLDVDFADFEASLKGDFSADRMEDMMGGNLKRLVENFEKFLNDENAGIEGVEDSDEMDHDDDSDEEDESDEEEDKEISFDEVEFARMMREMMGLPPEEGTEVIKKVEEVNDESESEEDIREHMDAVEKELREAGALDGNSDDEDKELDIDYNLAKNMLEAFKSQGGLPGPAGNLLKQMGIVLPRDEGDDEEEDLRK